MTDSTVRVACIQNCATPDVDENVANATRLCDRALADGAKLICLPEYFSGLKTDGAKLLPIAYPADDHSVLRTFQQRAADTGAWYLLGSLGVTTGGERISNRSYLIDDQGNIAAHYDKIHMFDIDLGSGNTFRESETVAPGKHAVVAGTPWGRLGMTICYDLRFASLYRSLAQAGGADILSVPAAFTKKTGEAHWHVLNRARAIEHGAFVVAPCQYGTLDGGAQCFGHSLIVDPWGKVLAEGAADAEDVIVADLDMAAVAAARQRIPALQHDREYQLG